MKIRFMISLRKFVFRATAFLKSLDRKSKQFDLAKMPTSENSGGVSHPTYPPVDTALSVCDYMQVQEKLEEDKLMASPSSDLQQQPRPKDKIRELLVDLQMEFEYPSLEDMDKVPPFHMGNSEADRLMRAHHMTEITVLTVQLIVEFSKRVPGFDSLCLADKISLLKAHSSEVMVLRAARNYDMRTDTILFQIDMNYHRDDFQRVSVKGFADDLFRFCRKMSLMQLSNAEYALLTAIVIFSETHGLLEPTKVKMAFDFYMEALISHIAEHRGDQKYFPRLLFKLEELKLLGYLNKRQYFSYREYYKTPPALLEEMWNQ